MRFAVLTSAVALIGTASAQIPLASLGLPNLSASCQAALVGLLSGGDLATCTSAASLLPLLTSNSSVIPALDNLMSNTCYGQPCSNATIQNAVQTLTAGCQADIQSSVIKNDTISYAFGLYPLIREVLCTKTSMPYTASSYGGFLGAPATPITAYNSTGNAYFCVTSLLTQLTAYFGTPINVPYIVGLVSMQNSTAVNLVQSIQANFICNECIFGAVDIISLQFPNLRNLSALNTLGQYLPAAKQIPPSTTLQQAMDSTCAYKPLSLSTNGTLPAGVSVAIVNSTFRYPVTNGPVANPQSD